jgi:polyisoprenoid-binding protein YceI
MTTQTWTIDPSHSGVHFSVRHMVVSKVRGRFPKFEGTVSFDEAAPAAGSVSVKIETASIDTGDAKRDGHLRSPDFFDAEKYPEITFRSTKVQPSGGKRYRVTGELSIHGVAKEVVLDAELLGAAKDPWGNQRIGFSASTSIDRKDYGLNWNQLLEAGGMLVGEKVEIELEVEAIAAAAAATQAA